MLYRVLSLISFLALICCLGAISRADDGFEQGDIHSVQADIQQIRATKKGSAEDVALTAVTNAADRLIEMLQNPAKFRDEFRSADDAAAQALGAIENLGALAGALDHPARTTLLITGLMSGAAGVALAAGHFITAGRVDPNFVVGSAGAVAGLLWVTKAVLRREIKQRLTNIFWQQFREAGFKVPFYRKDLWLETQLRRELAPLYCEAYLAK